MGAGPNVYIVYKNMNINININIYTYVFMAFSCTHPTVGMASLEFLLVQLRYTQHPLLNSLKELKLGF